MSKTQDRPDIAGADAKIVCTARDSCFLLKQKNPKHSSLIQPGPAWIIILSVSGIYASLLWAQWSAEVQGGTELSEKESQNIVLYRYQGSATEKTESSQTICNPSEPRRQSFRHFWLRKECSTFFFPSKKLPSHCIEHNILHLLMGHTAKSIKQIPRSSLVTNKTDIPTEGKNKAQIMLRILHHSEYLGECMLLDLWKKVVMNRYIMNTQSLRLNRGTVTFCLPYMQDSCKLCLVKAQSSAQLSF